MGGNDPLAAAVGLEEELLQQGFEEGFGAGANAGLEEGRQVGLKTGFEVGEEVGFYRGCLDLWQAALQRNPQLFSARTQHSLEQLHRQLLTFPLFLPQDEQLHDRLGLLRAKFRAVASLLSLPLQNIGLPDASPKAASDF